MFSTDPKSLGMSICMLELPVCVPEEGVLTHARVAIDISQRTERLKALTTNTVCNSHVLFNLSAFV